MKYIILLDDELHRNALEDYYNKYYKSKLDVDFLPYSDYVESVAKESIVIAEKSRLDGMGITKKCLYISDGNNNSINIFQSAQSIYQILENYTLEVHSIEDKVKMFGFSGIGGSSGATILSIHAAKLLGESSKTLFVSLEKIPSGKCYLEQSQGNSLSNVIFYFKKDDGKFIEKLKDIYKYNAKYCFYYFSDVEYLEDLIELKDDEILELVDTLKECSFKNIVIDFGTRLDLLCRAAADKKFIVAKQNLKQYKMLEGVSKYIGKYDDNEFSLLVNQKREDVYINESYLRLFKSWDYIPYDFKLADGDMFLISNELVSVMKEVL